MGKDLAVKLPLNIAYIVLNQSLWQDEQSALDRQRAMSLAIKLLDAAGQHPASISDGLVFPGECAMIPATAMAEYHRRLGNLDLMMGWLQEAVTAVPYPPIQNEIILSPWLRVNKQRNVEIDWNSPNWEFQHDAPKADVTLEGEQLFISYMNDLGNRETAIYTWQATTVPSYWSTVQIRVKVDEGTFLTIDIQSDSDIDRVVNYDQGNGRWQEFIIPVNIEELRAIHISMGEPSADSTIPIYEIEMEPIQFLLDKTMGTCK